VEPTKDAAGQGKTGIQKETKNSDEETKVAYLRVQISLNLSFQVSCQYK
jgi:hypothetical protein